MYDMVRVLCSLADRRHLGRACFRSAAGAGGVGAGVVRASGELHRVAFVDALKSSGGFTKEKQLEAFQKSRDKALEILGDTAVAALNEIYGDFDAWIDTKIEQVCRDLKRPDNGEAATTAATTAAATAASVATTIAATTVQQLELADRQD